MRKNPEKILQPVTLIVGTLIILLIVINVPMYNQTCFFTICSDKEINLNWLIGIILGLTIFIIGLTMDSTDTNSKEN
ncbi:MAG: hypothetical protein ACOC2U_04060 [bacterium]